MSNKAKLCMILFLLAVILTSFTACKKIKTEDVIIEFLTSDDKGETWRAGVFNFPAFGESVYLMVRIQVHTNHKEATFPSVYFTTWKTEHVDAFILEANTSIEPSYYLDSAKYEFSTRAIKNNDRFTSFIVEFIPYGEDRVTVNVAFDDSIEPIHGGTRQLIFGESLNSNEQQR